MYFSNIQNSKTRVNVFVNILSCKNLVLAFNENRPNIFKHPLDNDRFILHVREVKL